VETTIKVENLSKSYANVKAVEHLNLSICRGEVFCLLGANGAGKSKRSVFNFKKPIIKRR
jgi:ABC-2 type transport system ATP-binding protein